MLRLAFDFIITWRETRTRPNAYKKTIFFIAFPLCLQLPQGFVKTTKHGTVCHTLT